MSSKLYTELVDDEGRQLWTTAQCAQYCGLSTSVFRNYVFSKKTGPAPVGFYQNPDPSISQPPVRVFLAEEIKEWNSTRPTRG